ncbi:MAG TPA: FAD-binding oxidoreductase [Casimicrobiaceae bacterium]|nr:FAD-binding oxidoreductase [Casimicrobiaceae bacterium]
MRVNDVHSRLNATDVAAVVAVRSVEDVGRVLGRARAKRLCVAIAGGRHAMGGQQFVRGGVLLDMTGLDRVISFDPVRGLIEVEAGIMWPALHDALVALQRTDDSRWTFRQKQTGADRFTIGGALSANIHGRGLAMPPFVADVEGFTLVDARGHVHCCSRNENRHLFSLAIGGYGLFGVIVTVTLRLTRRSSVQRIVDLIDVGDVMAEIDMRIAEGCLYGDFQFAIDSSSDDFLRRGILSCYRPVAHSPGAPDRQSYLSERDWQRLLHLAHVDKRSAFDEFASFYLSTARQVYGSDDHQLGYYLDGYHTKLDARLGHCGSEMIGELYVPRGKLVEFLSAAAQALRTTNADVIYGTVRLIARDQETFLPWARDDYACVVFNLHTPHTVGGVGRTATAFRALIDAATMRQGSFYLTYHRYATRSQVLAGHPRFEAFVRAKEAFDPDLRFQSDWYRHYQPTFRGPAVAIV